MTFIGQVRAKRKKLADVLMDEDYSGIREIVEELYPDKAHFIYELLQNAEDVCAKEAVFALEEDRLIFEHDGVPFSEDDVWGITNIGKGSKKDDDDKIGRFGVGFKAVFAYTNTPRIWSPSHCFEITDLVLPGGIAARADLKGRTRFEFPFDNPKKPRRVAYDEVLDGLMDLAETTLLFLSSLESIAWRIGDRTGQVLRVPHSKNHIEVLKNCDGRTTSSQHFLRFTRNVVGLERHAVALAFAMEFIPDVNTFNNNRALGDQLVIKSAAPGKVSVFFPAEKETSGLRFHLHAPFVPELSRASIKDTPANIPLFGQLAALAGSALHTIRDLGLLDRSFLAVLPNPLDEIAERYRPIRNAIVEEMNQADLTPTQAKSYAPARSLLQASAAMKDLLSEADLEFLVDHVGPSPKWAVSAAQKNSNADRFLSGLDITAWGVGELIKEFTRVSTQFSWISSPDPAFKDWMAGKSAEWYQQLYALLFNELSESEYSWKITTLEIILLSSGDFSVGNQCYFPSEGVISDEVLPRIAEGTYSSGKSKVQQAAARKFLETVGVREVGPLEQVRAILDQRYVRETDTPDEATYIADLKNFIRLVEREPTTGSIFADYFVLRSTQNGPDGPSWVTPGSAYLDSTFVRTGLSRFWNNFSDAGARLPVVIDYENRGVSLSRFIKFSKAIGVQTELEAVEVRCTENPQWDYLRNVGGQRPTSPIDRDYVIPGLSQVLGSCTIEVSKMIWTWMACTEDSPDFLVAKYQKNYSHGFRTADSQLVHLLRTTAWVPQGESEFVVPAEADIDRLPRGFAADLELTWLKKVNFGEESQKREEESEHRRKLVHDLGFKDEETFQRAQRFGELPTEEQENLLADFEGRKLLEFPEHESKNRERRNSRVSGLAEEAPGREVETRSRSVSVNRESVKGLADPYLREQYSNQDGELFCQICRKPMPFRMDDGRPYFEKVEFLESLEKRYRENYLALCPNHAAMFKVVNDSKKLLLDMFGQLDSTQLEVTLAKESMNITFTKTHIDDLRQVIAVDEKATAQWTALDRNERSRTS